MKSLFVYGLFAVVIVVLTPNQSDAQYRGGWWGGGDSSLNLLQNDKIREDLELGDDQVEELKTMRDEIYQEMRGMWSGMRDLSREERREKFEELRTEMESRRGEMEERINSVLLPHQQKRLNQLTMQSKARRQGGTISFAASDTLAEKLNLTEEQKAKLKEAADSAKKELEKKINKLKEKAEQQVLSVLTKEQRQQYAELMGDAFKFEERSGWGNRDRSADRRSGESDKESKNN